MKFTIPLHPDLFNEKDKTAHNVIPLVVKFLLFSLQPRPDLIDAPYHRHDENGHGRHQPRLRLSESRAILASALPSVSRLDRRSKESHGVVEVILPRVIAEDGKDDERHFVHQMVNDAALILLAVVERAACAPLIVSILITIR